MPIPYWTQRADFSSTDHRAPDVDQAVSDFVAHDWESEDRLLDELESRLEDNCPAGFGFPADDGRLLHVCRHTDSQFYFLYDYKGKIFGLIRAGKSATSKMMTIDEAAGAIRHFFDCDHDWLMGKCRG